MKKYILAVAVGVLFFGGFAMAKTEVESLSRWLGKSSSGFITGEYIDKSGIQILKFVDGKNTCYTAITKVGANNVNASITCLK